MRYWFLVILLLLFWGGPQASSATFPTCSSIGQSAGCGGNTLGSSLWDEAVNIRFFGAKGDNSTDDTAAIQAAIDFAANNKIQNVICPAGLYKISSTIYLDPPGNLRSNFANPPNSSFSLSFIGQGQSIGNHEQFGCWLLPQSNSGVAFIVGPGQHMKVSGIAISGPFSLPSGYRCNLNNTGIGLGISGGGGGASFTLIENTLVESFYKLYATGANGNGSLSDSNTFRKVDGFNGCYGIYISATQNFINDVEDSRMAGVNTSFISESGPPIDVRGGNYSATNGVSASFGISGTSSFTKTADQSGFDYTFTTTVASPDSYWPNVYNAFNIPTAHFGVVPLQLSSWNAGTDVATFLLYQAWVFSNFAGTDLTTSTDLQNEIAAATKVYAAERVRVAAGTGISMEGIHIENPGACQGLYQASSGFAGSEKGIVNKVFYNSDPSFYAYRPAASPTDAQLALFYCQQNFPLIEQGQWTHGAAGGTAAHLDIANVDFGQQINYAPLMLVQQGPYRFLSARNLSGLAPPNLRMGDPGNSVWGFSGQGGKGANNEIETVQNGGGEWDAPYFLPHGLVDSFHAVTPFMQNGSMLAPYIGYKPAPGYTTPQIQPRIFNISNALGALGSNPPIDCQTVYKYLDFDSGALSHIFARSASCPGYSYGQPLDDSTVGSVTGTFTSTISNGSGGAGTQLNVTAIASGAPSLNAEVTGTGVPASTYITACPGGSCGGTGIYTVNNSANVAAEVMQSFTTTVTWLFKGASAMIYPDATTMQWLFPGLTFTTSGGNTPSSHKYVVTGIFPQLGYATAIDSQGFFSQLAGVLTTTYSCSNQCALGQVPFSWTQY